MVAALLVVGTLAAAMRPSDSSVQPTMQPTARDVASSEVNGAHEKVLGLQSLPLPSTTSQQIQVLSSIPQSIPVFGGYPMVLATATSPLKVNTDPLPLPILGVTIVICILMMLFEIGFGEKVLIALRLRNAAAAETKDEDTKSDAVKTSQVDEARSMCEKVVLFLAGCISAFVGELYYGIVVPFFPVEAVNRGIASDLIGLIIGAHALGVIVFGQFVPNLLRYHDPMAMLRATLLMQTVAMLGCGLSGGLQGTAFAVTFGVFRFLLGGLASITEMCAQAIAFRCAPYSKVPTVVAIFVAVRSLGPLFGSAVGSFIYPLPNGGWPAPFFVGAIVFVLLYFVFFTISAYTKRFDPIISTASVLTVLKVPLTWPCLLATPFLGFILTYALEPLYAPIYSSAPYFFSYQDIGLISGALPLGMSITVFLIATWMHEYTGPSLQQALGASCIFTGATLLGPSPILGGAIQPSTGLAIGALMLVGGGVGICVPTTPMFMLRILEREAGLTKAEVGGSLATTAGTMIMIGALVAPTVSSIVYNAVGFQWVTGGWALVYAGLYIPCALVLLRYNWA